MVRAITEGRPTATLLSIGPFDNVSRAGMLGERRTLPGASAMLPLLRLSYAQPSHYVSLYRTGPTYCCPRRRRAASRVSDAFVVSAQAECSASTSKREAQAESRCWGHQLAQLHLYENMSTRKLQTRHAGSALEQVPDLQCVSQFLIQCAGSRAKHLLRTLLPSQSQSYAAAHDASMWTAALEVPRGLPGDEASLVPAANLVRTPLTSAGLGLWSIEWTAPAAL